MTDQVPESTSDAIDEPVEQPAEETVEHDGGADDDVPELSGEAEVANADSSDHGDSADEPPTDRPVEATGHPAVDEVLRSLGRLEEQPVSEHVGVFERAHENLRGALSDAGDPQD